MKDVADLFVWVWALLQTAAYYIYEASMLFVTAVYALYNMAYQYMSSDPNFQSVPHLGKVMISSVVAGIIPLVTLGLLKALIPAFVRGHLQESGLASSVGAGGSQASNASARPYVTFSDPSIRILDIRQRSGGSWSADVEKNGSRMNLFIGTGNIGSRSNIGAFGSQGEVNWGN